MSRLATASRGLAFALATAVVVAACSTFAPPESLQSVDPEAMTAPMPGAEVRAEVERAMRDTPLPSGAVWTPVDVDPNAWYGAWGGGSMIEFQALCAWLREAADATKVNDPERLATVAEMLTRIASWRTFSDPALMDTTSRAFIQELLADARRHEFAAVGHYLAANCP